MELLRLRLVETGGRLDQRNPPLPAEFDDPFCGGRQREIDHGIDGHVESVGQRHADHPNAGNHPSVFSQARMARRVDRRRDGELRIGRGQRHQPASHLSRGPVNRYTNWHGFAKPQAAGPQIPKSPNP